MNKYIDADKLIAEITRLKGQLIRGACASQVKMETNCKDEAYDEVLAIITSIQQEQPKLDLVAKLKHHLDTTPREQLEKEWKELEHWNNVGPTVQEFLYGKQSEVDLEKFAEKIKNFQVRYKHPESISIKAAMAFMARMFYQYPNVARMWYDSLPKATQD